MYSTMYRGICHGTWCTVVGPQIAKPKKSAKARIELRTTHLHIHRPDDPQIAKPKKNAHVRIELRTSHLHVHRPTMYPDKPFPDIDYDCILTQAWCGTQDKFGQTAFPGNAGCPNSHVTFCSLPVSTRIKVYYVNLYQ